MAFWALWAGQFPALSSEARPCQGRGRVLTRPLVDDVRVLQVVQLALHVVDVLIDLPHALTVPADLVLANLRGNQSPVSSSQKTSSYLSLSPVWGKERAFFEVCMVPSFPYFPASRVPLTYLFEVREK